MMNDDFRLPEGANQEAEFHEAHSHPVPSMASRFEGQRFGRNCPDGVGKNLCSKYRSPHFMSQRYQVKI